MQTESSSQGGDSTISRSSSLSSIQDYESNATAFVTPKLQQQLLIHAPKEPYSLKHDSQIPEILSEHEVLVRVEYVGLNPIDWKGPAFGFGLPSLPCVLGRDFVGTIVKVPENLHPTIAGDLLQPGDKVLSISTNYRDYRKAAFQQYAVASIHNVCRLPRCVHQFKDILPAAGVAFVAAALTLGICLGLDFSKIKESPGPDIYKMVRKLPEKMIAEDVRDECLHSLPQNERIRSGDWLAIWGASSTVGYLALQIAKKAGINVVCVANLTRHGALLEEAGADILVHRAHPEEAVSIIQSMTEDKCLRYGIDTAGKDSAQLLQSSFSTRSSEDEACSGQSQHLACLVGAPKMTECVDNPQPRYHKVPIKLFHECPEIGGALMMWLEELLITEEGIRLPKTDVYTSTGLESINEGLDRLRDGRLDGQRLVVRI